MRCGVDVQLLPQGHARFVNLIMARLGFIEYGDTRSLDQLRAFVGTEELDVVVERLARSVEAQSEIFDAQGRVAASLPEGSQAARFVLQQEALDAGRGWRASYDRLAVGLRSKGGLARLLARDADPAAGRAGSAGSDQAGREGAGGAGLPPARSAAAGRRAEPVGVRPEPGFDPGQRQGRLLETSPDERVASHLARVGVIIDVEIEKLTPDAQAILRQSYQRAAELKDGFDALLERVAADIGGRALLPSLKGSARAVEKIATDYEGDAGKIKDLLRATIEVDTVDQARAVVALLRQPFDVLDAGFRDLFDAKVNPVDGYRDAKMNVQLPGLVAEIQVNLPQMLEAKKKVHGEYAERSTIERESEGRLRTPQENARIAELNAKMKVVYDAAFAEAMSSRNLTSETGAPLRLAEPASNVRGGSVSQAADEIGTPGTLPRETGMPSTSKSSTSEGNFINTNEPNVSARAAAGNARAAEMVNTVDGPRAQLVMPGAEQISTGELLRRRQDQAGTARQQSGRAGSASAGDLPLFSGERNQGSLFEAPSTFSDLMVRQDVQVGDRVVQMERPARVVMAENDAQVERLKGLLACLRR